MKRADDFVRGAGQHAAHVASEEDDNQRPDDRAESQPEVQARDDAHNREDDQEAGERLAQMHVQGDEIE